MKNAFKCESVVRISFEFEYARLRYMEISGSKRELFDDWYDFQDDDISDLFCEFLSKFGDVIECDEYRDGEIFLSTTNDAYLMDLKLREYLETLLNDLNESYIKKMKIDKNKEAKKKELLEKLSKEDREILGI